MATFTELPPEILLPISAWLYEDDLYTLAKTCQKFRDMLLPAFVGQIWFSFSRKSQVSVTRFFDAIGNHPNLLSRIRKLKVDCTASFGDSDVEPSLRERLWTLPKSVSEANVRLYHHNNDLATESGALPCADDFTRLMEHFAANSNLQTLQISMKVSRFSKSQTAIAALESLAMALPHLHSLRSFSLAIVGSLAFERMDELETALGSAMTHHADTLECLDWEATSVFPLMSTSAKTSPILQFLAQCKKLRELRLGFGSYGWSTAGLSLVISALNSNPSIRLCVLTIEGSKETIAGACASAGGTSALSYVERLDLLHSEEVGSLAVLERFSALKSLSLSPGSVRALSLEELGAIVRSHTGLRALYVGGLHETGETMLKLLRDLADSDSLHTFRLRGFSERRAAGDGTELRRANHVDCKLVIEGLLASKLQLIEWNGVRMAKSSFHDIERLLSATEASPPNKSTFFSKLKLWR
ncbi:hypothetical protein BJ742DRAFT_272822 [Cladochytrium replicatum]|nr:hypothetical protein BJ742DRAFT_272822 [Cladochytrium replicatum]